MCSNDATKGFREKKIHVLGVWDFAEWEFTDGLFTYTQYFFLVNNIVPTDDGGYCMHARK